MNENNKLELLGGKSIINKPFFRSNPIVIEEKPEIIKAIESEVLSKFFRGVFSSIINLQKVLTTITGIIL